MDRIQEVVQALTTQLADKNDTKKALKLLERQIKNLYDYFMSKGEGGATHHNEEDAMFTRKPLGGTSCASCEKDVFNLQGRKVDYIPWSKLPKRDPNERIAKVGQGFSKMLSMINPDTLSRFDNMRPMHSHVHSSEREQHDEEMDHMHRMGGKAGATYHPTVNKTMNNFYNAQNQMTHSMKRPGSAQIAPKPKRVFQKGSNK